MDATSAKPGVYLIDPGTDSNLNLLPLGIGRIASYCRSRAKISNAFDCHVRWLRRPVREVADSLVRPVAVGLPCYVWNTQASLALARAVRDRHPDCLIVLGGASIPKRDDSIRAFLKENPCADVLVRGDGEVTFAEILEALADGRDLTGIRGLALRASGRPPGCAHGQPQDTVITAPRAWAKNLDMLPSPFLDGIFDDLMAAHRDKVTGVVLESNRGCPYSCSFCDWGSADLRKVKTFDLARVKAEVEWVGRNAIPYIFLADANFGILYGRDMELADHIAKVCRDNDNPKFLGVNWTKNSNARVVDIAERLLSGGVSAGVTLAAQSFHDPTLEAINRRNMKQDNVNKMRKLFHSKGIITYTDLILGLPEETLDSFLQGVEQVMTPDPNDHWVIHLCNILENSEMAEPAYLSRHGTQTRTCAVTMTLRIHDPDSVRENEVIVVGTKTMPIADWRWAYDVGYLCAALHNFRLAFFVMNLIKARFAVDHTEFASFIIDRARAEPSRWPVIFAGTERLRRQRQMILDGAARYSPVSELGGFNASPQEALLAMFLGQAEPFYAELRQMTQCLLDDRGLKLATDLLDDLFAYQRLRMTVWPPLATSRRLNYDLPDFFELLQRGQAVSEPQPGPCRIKVILPETEAGDQFEHARRRTRGARYTDILELRHERL